MPATPFASPRASSGASNISVYTGVYSGSPRGFTPLWSAHPSPRAARVSTADPTHQNLPTVRPQAVHTTHYGWTDPSTASVPRSTTFQRSGDRYHAAQSLHYAPHPFLKPSQRDHGNEKDTGLPDALPPRASRKPRVYTDVKAHDAHVLSWPGSALFVAQHFYRPPVDSRHVLRGDLPPSAQMLVSPGSRPPFPTHSLTAKVGM